MKIKKTEMTPQVRADIKERQKLVWDSLFYSNQRMDLLMITICGAGLYAISEVCKYLLQHHIHVSCFLKISAILLVISIITNFLSQYYSSKAHYKDYCSIILQLEENRTPEQDNALIRYDKESEQDDKTTRQLNSLSMVFMFAGLLFLTTTIYFIF